MSDRNEQRRPAAEPDGAGNLIVGDDNSNGTARPAASRGDAAYESYLKTVDPADAKRWTDSDLVYAVAVHREGFLARLGEAGDDVKAAAEWQQIKKVPTFDELQARRSDPFRGPCSLKSCRGRCSQCIRAAAIVRNRARYGGNGDYPGVGARSRNGRRGVA